MLEVTHHLSVDLTQVVDCKMLHSQQQVLTLLMALLLNILRILLFVLHQVQLCFLTP